MKLILFGDLHYTERQPISRKDDYSAAIAGKLEEIYEIARKHKVEGICCTGDFFDKKRPTFHETRSLVSLLQKSPVPVYGIYGNHDTFNLDGAKRRAAGILEVSGAVRILDHEVVLFTEDKVALSGTSFSPKNTRLPTKSKPGWFRIHLTHMDIYLSKPDRPVPYIPVSKLKKVKADIIFNGHIHYDSAGPSTTLKNGTQIYNLGSIGRPRYDDFGRPSILLLEVQGGVKTNERIIELQSAGLHKEVFLKRTAKQENDGLTAILAFAKQLSREGQETGGISVEEILKQLARKMKMKKALPKALKYLEEV